MTEFEKDLILTRFKFAEAEFLEAARILGLPWYRRLIFYWFGI